MSIIADLVTLLKYPGFQRLFTVRIISQCGDGLFQVGLVSLYFFNPTAMATVGGVALAFTILLLPFTVVGPFVGPLLDRWSRQRVLLYGNLVRSVLCITLALLIYSGASVALVSVLALITLGVNRFLLSALSAGLPHVVPRDKLLMANTLTPTLGAISLGVGAATGLVVNFIAPAGPARDATNLLTAATILLIASWAATRIRATELGPDGRPPIKLSKQFASVFVDLGKAATYLAHRGTPAYALVVMAAHRFLYGVNFIALLLISRNLLSNPMDPDDGMVTFALLGGLSFVGNALAIVATPIAHERMRPSTWIGVCLGLSLVSQAILIGTYETPWIIGAAILMGLGVQGAKIAVDTVVQRDVDDAYRGRTFALYDVGYNAAFVGAAGLAAAVMPDTGWSRLAFGGLAILYVLLGTWYAHVTRAVGDEPRPVPGN